VADHIEHIRDVAGADHVGLGGDFDGITDTVEGLNGVEDYPNLFAELIRRGWSDRNLRKLAGGNVLRVMRQAEAVAKEMKGEPAAMAEFDEKGPSRPSRRQSRPSRRFSRIAPCCGAPGRCVPPSSIPEATWTG
jgi:hypothetical protein